MSLALRLAPQQQPPLASLQSAQRTVLNICGQPQTSSPAELSVVLLTCLHQLRKALESSSSRPACQVSLQPTVYSLLAASPGILAAAVGAESSSIAARELVARHAGSVAAMLVAAAKLQAGVSPNASLADAFELLRATLDRTGCGPSLRTAP